MATASSFKRAQLPVQCKFCERTDVKVTWKCIDCDLIMCTTCKDKIHPKFKSAERHRVVLLKDIERNVNSEEINFDLHDVKEYSTQLRKISSILVAEGGCFWIADYSEPKKYSLFSSSKTLQKIKLRGKNVILVDNIKPKSTITDIAVLPSGDLIVCDDKPILKQVKDGTKTFTDSVFNVDPYEAISIHVTKDCNIVVGANKTYEHGVFGVVIIMDMDGTHLKTIERDENGKPLFNYPFRIRSTKSGEILVLNSIDYDWDFILVLLNASGNVVFEYDGHSSENLYFSGFVVTPSENIIITDPKNDKLHILSSKGQLLKYIDTTHVGIYYPFSLTIASVEEFCVLYIGCVTADDDSEKARVYRMILTETNT